MAFNPEKPYNDLPLLPPEIDFDDVNLLKKLITANKALAELKGIAAALPNQELLIHSIPLQEAQASSEIENIVTTNDELFEAYINEEKTTDPNTKEVLRYRQALLESFNDLVEKEILTTNSFIKIVQTIKENRAGIRKTPGTKLKNANGVVVYTPPETETVLRDKLSDLEKFIHNYENIDPLIKMAIVHYQFEAIHPFTDGNGRTGRIINILILIMNELLDMPILYLSKYIIEKKSEYYSLLRNVTEKEEWVNWILYILDAVEVSSNFTIKLSKKILKLNETTLELVKEKLNLKSPKEVVDLIFERPYSKIDFFVKKQLFERKAAGNTLKQLVEVGVLSEKKSGKGNIYINVKLVELFKEFSLSNMNK